MEEVKKQALFSSSDSAHINNIPVQTAKQVVPQIYAYTTPGISYHDGWTKIGYTEKDPDKRIQEQTKTADIVYKLEWHGNAVFEGTDKPFKDTVFHQYLRKLGYEQKKDREWFVIDPTEAKYKFYEFRENEGVLASLPEVREYTLRPEQEEAVKKTIDYMEHRNVLQEPEFLWNAKPRFGKTLATYDFCKRIGAKKVLIVTNRPAISNSWYSDYEKFLGTQSGYYFVSEDRNLKDKKYVMSREGFESFKSANRKLDPNLIEFVSLQDLKGSVYFGGTFNKLESIKDTQWDVLVIDEAHEAIDTMKTDRAFDNIRRKFTLHLSGTPFKAMAKGKFPEDAIYNWTYADEQKAKRDWKGPDENPYIDLPKLNLFTYKMSDIVEDRIREDMLKGKEIDEYAFDLNEFFKTENGRFTHDKEVDEFLDALTKREKFPFSTPALRDELRHTFWLLNRVDSARALYKKLKNHPVFKDYEIILAAGDGRVDEDDERENTTSFYKVKNAIHQFDKTITLSVGQLTTGVTIPEWTAVLMLCNKASAQEYIQAAFRAQNPHLFQYGTEFKRKENAYVFDFDPARTLNIFEEFANDLYSSTSGGHGTKEEREDNIRTLLNYFPVYGENNDGKMIALDAEKVLRIPRRIRAVEVVKSGFKSNFLFANISNIFGAPKAVTQILEQVKPEKETKANKKPIDQDAIDSVKVDEHGNTVVDEKVVIGTATDLLGKKEFAHSAQTTSSTIKEELKKVHVLTPETTAEPIEMPVSQVRMIQEQVEDVANNVKESIKKNIVDDLVTTAQQAVGQDLRKSEKKQLSKELSQKVDRHIQQKVDDFKQQTNILGAKVEEAMQYSQTPEESLRIKEEFEKKKMEAVEKLKNDMQDVNALYDSLAQDSVEQVKKAKQDEKKRTVMDDIRDRLRGLSRTIPSFLMAYGNDSIVLANFDEIVPDDVFKEVTSISLDDFRFLRDGGERLNPETGQLEYFEGHFFDELVFDDSITEFMKTKDRLADYFDESQNEDIFDYIPPQQTNQIFTPKRIVKQMVDLLEKENPGCFDDPTKTFADLYMKSGLFITEIVKRLYASTKLKEQFPDDNERLKHIFEHQVYGMAPTEIIYRIAMNYIFGFDENKKIDVNKDHFVKEDASKAAQEGTLRAVVDKHFG